MEERSRPNATRWLTTALTILLGGVVRPAAGQPPLVEPTAPRATDPPSPGRALTLESAVRYALLRNPEVRVGEARLGEGWGRLKGAGRYPYNPVLEGGAASRQGSERHVVDFEIGISQRIEVAGQRGDRIDSAHAELAAQRAGLLRAKRLLAARVHLAFVAALEARDLLEVSRVDMELVRRLHHLAQRRLDRGAGTQLDVNVAAAELGRVEARYQAFEASYHAKRAALAEAMGLDPIFLPLPQGELHTSHDAATTLEQVVASAGARRADLRALRDLETAGRARLELARSQAWPDVTVRAFVAHEEGSDTVFGGALSVPLPLFNRNQGRIEETRARVERLQAERLAGEFAMRRDVVSAHARYRAGLRASERFRELVLGTLEQNIELLQRSFEAGKATWPEVVVIRRTLVDAQRELTTTEASARRAWIELQLAAGRMPVPDSVPRSEETR